MISEIFLQNGIFIQSLKKFDSNNQNVRRNLVKYETKYKAVVEIDSLCVLNESKVRLVRMDCGERIRKMQLTRLTSERD